MATKKEIAKSPAQEAEVLTIIESLPKEKQKVIIQALHYSQQHSGPLPSAEVIKVYAEVIPNGGDRLMANVETQSTHRIDIEKVGVRRTFNQSSTGQWLGFAIALFFGIISWDLAKSGHDAVAGLLGSIDLVALVTVFVYGNKAKQAQ